MSQLLSEVKILLANREDYLQMIEIADLSFPDRMNLHELKKYFEFFPALIFKAMYNEQMIGFACAGINMYQDTGWLIYNAVLPEFQGKGIGKKLIEVRLEALKLFPKLRSVFVTVNEANIPTNRALATFGFKLKTTELNYYGLGKHRNILEYQVDNQYYIPSTIIHPKPDNDGAIIA